jgi:acetyl-CoA synthetase
MMGLKELMAPEVYNVTHEIEKHNSDKVALIWENDQGDKQLISYSELIKKSNQFANGLIELGLKKGDRVLIIAPRLIQTYIIYMACLKAGLVIIPSSEMLRAKDLSYRLNHSEAKAIISYASFTQEVDKIKEETFHLSYKISFGDEVKNWLSMEGLMRSKSENFDNNQTTKDDFAFFSYTSGTTGNPKAAVHTHGWAYAHLRIASSEWLDIKENDLVWATAAPGWQKWVWSPFLSILGSGATGYVYQGSFNPETYLSLLEKHKINVLCCTPTEYRMFSKTDHLDNFDLSSIRSAVSAGEALNREVIDTFQKHFDLLVRDGYGQTESTLLIGTLQGKRNKIGSMGQPILDEFMEIVDDEGLPVTVGEVGNIGVRKDFPALFKMYYKDKERTVEAIKGNYYLTGDRAYKDEENFYWFQGRRDDIIISSGYTIGPFEIEDALMKNPKVKECAAVASPDEIRGNVVKAFIVLKEGVEESSELAKELQNYVKNLTAPYKYPRIIEFIDQLPKTDSGKIKRVALKNR